MTSHSSSFNKPTLIIPPHVWDKIMHMSANSDRCEVSGLGLIEMGEGGTMTVVETFLVPQENASAETTMRPEGIGKAMFLTKDKPGLLKWHWHSHVNMSTFWSGTDYEMIRQNGRHGWFVHTVVNIKGDKKTSIYQKEPFETFIDDVPTVIGPREIDPAIIEQWNKEYGDNVTLKTYQSPHWSTGYQGNYQNGYLGTQHVSPMKELIPQELKIDEPEGKTRSKEDILESLRRELAKADMKLNTLDAELEAEPAAARRDEILQEWMSATDTADHLQRRIEALEESVHAAWEGGMLS